MPLLVIVAVLIAFSYEPSVDASRIDAFPAAVAAIALVVSYGLLAEIMSRFVAHRIEQWQRDRPLLSYQYLRGVMASGLLGGYAGLIHVFNWPAVVAYSWRLEGWILADELLVLAPFAAAMIVGWFAFFRVEEAMRARSSWQTSAAPRWNARWHYVDFQIRHHLGVVLLPLSLLVLMQDLVSLCFRGSVLLPAAELGAGIAGLLVVLSLAPVILRFLWQASPMPSSPLRMRLERLSQRLGFHVSNFLIWNTHGAVINAAVAGILPWPRYVLFTDALLDHLTPDEVEAVLGHEAGHVRHHHLWFFFAFLLGASSLMTLMGTAAKNLLGFPGGGYFDHAFTMGRTLFMPLTCLVVYFGVFFGFLSRRFERQADIFGCLAVSCGRSDCPENHVWDDSRPRAISLCPMGIQIFVGALEKIATLSGSVRDNRSWRHFSIARRVEFLESIALRPERERAFQRVVLILKVLVLLVLLAGVWFVILQPQAFAISF